jgi:endonuclease YncB( thermonuclease family)
MDRPDHVGQPVTGRRRARGARLALAALACLLPLLPALPARAEAPEVEFVPRATRNVTPPGVTPGPEVDGPLFRDVPPPEEIKPEPAKWRRFALPETTDTATLHARNLTIRISGVDPVPVERTCRLADGEEWPCGRTGLVSFRRFLGGRAVECYFPPVVEATEIIAPCRVGRIDLGEWLLRQGWGTPNDYATDDYREAALAGRCERLGVWRGTAADGTCPARAE